MIIYWQEVARQTIRKALDTLHAPNVRDLAVRVNSVVSGLAEEDLKTVLKAKRLPDTLMLPKVDSVGHIQWVRCKTWTDFDGPSWIQYDLFCKNKLPGPKR